MGVSGHNRLRVVTIGGGHGQANILKALSLLDCEISAVVAVSDDGGCSGLLRRKHNMPPPGDLRRCLTALAGDKGMAELFETRLRWERVDGRSFGNMILSDLFASMANLQVVSDIAADYLECVGRVMPASLKPCTLSALDQTGQVVVGESRIADSGIKPQQVRIVEEQRANPHALQALAAADVILVGPGSFYTSVLAAFAVPEIARAYVNSPARKALLINLAHEGRQTAGMLLIDYVESLARHLGAPLERVVNAVIADPRTLDGSVAWLPESIKTLISHLRDGGAGIEHDPGRTAGSLSRWYGIPYADAQAAAPRMLRLVSDANDRDRPAQGGGAALQRLAANNHLTLAK